MAAFKKTKTTYLIELTYDEVMFLKGITQNQLYDSPLPYEEENRESIFYAMKEALEIKND